MELRKNSTQLFLSAQNCAVKFLGYLSSLAVWVIFIFFFSYLFYKGFLAISHYGFKNIFLTFQYGNNKYSYWAPFIVTAFLAFTVTLISIPIAIKCSVWISFYCPHKFKKIVSTVLLLMANFPSIVLAMFSKKYISLIVSQVLRMQTSLNLITASISLVCMILPITISLFNSVLKNQKQFLISAEVMGLSRTTSIYKLVIPKIRNTIFISMTMIVGKVLSESIMLSILLSSESYSQTYKKGFFVFINSQLNSVAPLISDNFFSDGSKVGMQNLMFLFGGLLIINSLVFNRICLSFIDKTSKKTNSRISKFASLKNYIQWRLIVWNKERVKKIVEVYRKSTEIICVMLLSLFIISILSSILIEGVIAIFNSPKSYLSLDKNSLLRTTLNTFLVVILSIFSAAPIALLSSIYLSEYAKDTKFKKYTLALINTSNSTPSIIFGILGLSLFISTLGWTATGRNGNSLLSGILTTILLILPYLTHLFYTHISSVDKPYRESSYALGVCKYQTFCKIVLPIISSNLIFSILLSIGKIIGETAPMYLTAGLMNIDRTLIMYPGQTLVTRIYSQIFEISLDKAYQVMNETILFCVMLIAILVVIGKYRVFLLRKPAIKGRLRSLKWQLYLTFWFTKKNVRF